jgi:hypothetical protein
MRLVHRHFPTAKPDSRTPYPPAQATRLTCGSVGRNSHPECSQMIVLRGVTPGSFTDELRAS